MNFCPDCGFKKDDFNFCPKCGFDFSQKPNLIAKQKIENTFLEVDQIIEDKKPIVQSNSYYLEKRNELISNIVLQWKNEYYQPSYIYIYFGIVFGITLLGFSLGNTEWFKLFYSALFFLSPIWIVPSLKYFPRINKSNNIITNIKREPDIDIKVEKDFEYEGRMLVKVNVLNIYVGKDSITTKDYSLIGNNLEEFIKFVNQPPSI